MSLMNCQEFEYVWDVVLDAWGAIEPVDPARALDAHAASCSACRAIHARNLLLLQAIRSLGPPAAVPDGFADRVLAAARAPAPKVLSIGARVVRLAAAAAVLAALVVGARAWSTRRAAPVETAQSFESEDLSEALVAATSATLDLAREASAPAARVGRQVLVAAELPETRSMFGYSDSVLPTAALWQTVGDRVNAGAGPLGGSARHAFGFLLGPNSDAPDPTVPVAAPHRGA